MRWADGFSRVHLVGVAGAGMSALARLLHRAGAQVSGSDGGGGRVLEDLRREGVSAWPGHHPECIEGHAGVVVRSAAVSDGDPEVVRCREQGFDSLLYAEALGRLTAHRRTVAVAGTHGKTSTSALLAAALRGGGVDSSHIVGGDVPGLGGNGYAGASDWLVVEACEFNRSFHQLAPAVAIVLNVDHDHFDCYPSLRDLHEAFAGFLGRLPSGGLAVVASGVPDAVLARLAPGVAVRRVGFEPSAACHPVELEEREGCWAFVPVLGGRRLPRVRLAVPGRFQVGNALAALAAADWAGAAAAGAVAALGRFGGVRRRFEVRTGPRGGLVVDDYAHHPVEIRAVLEAARARFPGRRRLVVFQPHQHQRTRALLGEFATELARAELAVVADIYGARETEVHSAAVSACDLVAAVRQRGGSCLPGGAVGDLPALVRQLRRPGDLLMLLGAGDIDRIVEDVVAEL